MMLQEREQLKVNQPAEKETDKVDVTKCLLLLKLIFIYSKKQEKHKQSLLTADEIKTTGGSRERRKVCLPIV